MGKQNRLADEQSPYLRMHADNPVDWYPWGEDAFEKAHREDKPVFLSIGYSTCHWCHVMEQESFSDPEVAQLLNAAFVNIKVDREERPDIDQIYMEVCQMLTERGGWPLTIIMTPEKQPFFAATYIPKLGRSGHRGLMDLIPQIRQLWTEDRDRVLSSAQEITRILQHAKHPKAELAVNESLLQTTFAQLAGRYDATHGGFGRAPKFPSPHHLLFLLRYWKRSGKKQALDMVEHTLRQMRLGGIFDHVGYGFHRYSTDREWLLPHFEKMLYDQAMLGMAYTEAYQATGDDFYRETTREIFTFVLREMTSPEGVFYSAIDADSEGREGTYYVWTTGEIRGVLDPDLADLFLQAYHFKKDGNFAEESTGEATGANIPYLSQPVESLAEKFALSGPELASRLEAARVLLFKRRQARTKPLLDDKILTDWNGLMIAAFARAGRAFTDPVLAEHARKAADFLLEHLFDENERLLHMYRSGRTSVLGTLADYAYLTWGLIELYQVSLQTRHLKAAMELADEMIVRFWDIDAQGFYFTPDDAEPLIARQKDAYDGAYPSANSVAMYALIHLARLTGNPDYEEYALKTIDGFSGLVKEHPAGVTMLMCGLDFAIGPASEVVITGERQAKATREMLRALWTAYLPNKVILFRPTDDADDITTLAEFTRAQTTVDNHTTAYVCHDFACEQPTTSVKTMLEQLHGSS